MVIRTNTQTILTFPNTVEPGIYVSCNVQVRVVTRHGRTAVLLNLYSSRKLLETEATTRTTFLPIGRRTIKTEERHPKLV